MNLVFHSVAALVFGWLIWNYVRAMRERTFLRELLAASRGLAPQRVWISAPEVALARAAAAFDVSYESAGKVAAVPRRIDLAALAAPFVLLELRKLRCRAVGGALPVVELHLAKDSEEASQLARRLTDACGLEVQIVSCG